MENKGFTILPEGVKNWYINLITPMIELLVRNNIHPNFFTFLGLILTVIAAYFYTQSSLVWAGSFLLAGGTCDIMDGKLARESGRASKFGAVLDSTVDRYSELIMFFGIGIYISKAYISGPEDDTFGTTMLVVTFLAMCGSMMVSYVRARAEGLGFDCKVGLMQRPERIVYIGFGSIFHPNLLIFVLWMIAIMANYTAYQRMDHVRKEEKAALDNESLDESLGI